MLAMRDKNLETLSNKLKEVTNITIEIEKDKFGTTKIKTEKLNEYFKQLLQLVTKINVNVENNNIIQTETLELNTYLKKLNEKQTLLLNRFQDVSDDFVNYWQEFLTFFSELDKEFNDIPQSITTNASEDGLIKKDQLHQQLLKEVKLQPFYQGLKLISGNKVLNEKHSYITDKFAIFIDNLASFKTIIDTLKKTFFPKNDTIKTPTEILLKFFQEIKRESNSIFQKNKLLKDNEATFSILEEFESVLKLESMTTNALIRKNNLIEKVTSELLEKQNEVQEAAKTLQDIKLQLEKNQQAAREQEEKLKLQQQEIQKRDEQIIEKEKQSNSLSDQLESMKQQFEEYKKTVEEQKKKIELKDKEITEKNKTIEEKNLQINEKEKEFEQKKQEVEKINIDLKLKEERLDKANKDLNVQINRNGELEKTVWEVNQTNLDLTLNIKNLNKTLMEKTQHIVKLNKTLEERSFKDDENDKSDNNTGRLFSEISMQNIYEPLKIKIDYLKIVSGENAVFTKLQDVLLQKAIDLYNSYPEKNGGTFSNLVYNKQDLLKLIFVIISSHPGKTEVTVSNFIENSLSKEKREALSSIQGILNNKENTDSMNLICQYYKTNNKKDLNIIRRTRLIKELYNQKLIPSPIGIEAYNLLNELYKNAQKRYTIVSKEGTQVLTEEASKNFNLAQNNKNCHENLRECYSEIDPGNISESTKKFSID